MAQEIRNCLTNIVTQMEAITADTVWKGATKFRHVEHAYGGEDLDTARGSTRRFFVALTGDSDNTMQDMHQRTESPLVEESVDVGILYPMGKNAWDLQRVIAEDHARIRWRLQRTDLWDEVNTKMSRRLVGGYSVEALDDEEDGGTALVTIPVDFIYRPSFS